MMKKTFLILSALIFTIGSAVFADGMVFDPTEYPVVTEIPVSKTEGNVNLASSAALPSNSKIETSIKKDSTLAQDSVSAQTGNFNNALFELDSAQVNIRNELLEYRAKYQEVDTQYQLIKEQRRVLNNQIKSIERKIRGIERSKNNIRKNMI